MPNAVLREHGAESVQLLPEPEGEAYKVFTATGTFVIIDKNEESVTYLEGIFISLDNNAKTAAISEYQFLMEKYNGFY